MKTSKKHLAELCALLIKIKDVKKMASALEDLLTRRELIEIAERWQIIKHLIAGKTQRQIAKQLHVSIGKVTRGSQVVQYGKMKWS